MLYPVSITSKWQMTIPKAVRKILNLNQPGKVVIEVDKEQKTLKINKTPDIFSLAGTFRPKRAINALKTRKLFEKYYERK